MSGHGQVVAVVAEAGTGKSRLVYEFKAALPNDNRVLEAYSVSHGKASAWLPVLELLHTYFGIEGVDDPPTRRSKLSARLATLDPALSDTMPYLSGLLGIQESPDSLAQMDPQVRRRRTLEALKRIILHETLEQPLVVIFEDLHWIDSETQALLDLLADCIANSRLLLLVSYRPEYRHEWANKSYYSQLQLDALGGESAGAMLAALLGDAVELAPLKRLIIERTEGNPFFIEEMVQALFEEGALVRNGTVKVTRPVSQLRLPATVQGTIAARIDRLPAEQKDLLQTLAVIGKEFAFKLVNELAKRSNDELERMLAQLQFGEFIYEQPAVGAVEYTFKHALTQEVAYGSQLSERRRQTHRRVAQAIEKLYRNRLDDHLDELARHYTAAGLIAEAIPYWRKTGEKAVERSADVEAIGHFSKALDLLNRLPDTPARAEQELTLQLNVARPLQAIKGWGTPEVEQACVRAMDLCRQIGDTPQMFFALNNLSNLFMIQGKFREALELAERALTLAQQQHDLLAIVGTHSQLGHAQFFAGEHSAARMHLEGGLATFERLGPQPPPIANFVRSWILGRLAQTLCILGYPDQGLRRMGEAVNLARAVGHAFNLTVALNVAAGVHYLRGEAERVRELSDEVIPLAREHEFPILLAEGTMMRGWALADLGQPAEGIAQIRAGLSAVAPTVILLPFYLRLLAEALEKAGQIDEGLAALGRGFEGGAKNWSAYHRWDVGAS